jgi:hypothetical protein
VLAAYFAGEPDPVTASRVGSGPRPASS